jgi:F-type H+-transporting ATPase subunit a
MHSHRTISPPALKLFQLIATAASLAIFASAASGQANHAPPATTAVPAQAGHAADSSAATMAAATAHVEPQHQEEGHEAAAHGEGDYIMEHVADGHEIDIPWPNKDLMLRVELPHWKPVQIGSLSIDLSPTKHVVMLIIAALLVMITLLMAARSHAKTAREGKAPKGLANAIEALVLYIRSDVILANVGKHGEAFVPYLLTCFFFILFANYLGLIPYASTATSNIGVTAALALLAFIVIEVAGMRALGWRYIYTIIYWPHDMPVAMKLPLTLILTPVELIGKFTKPFALAIRLFANMVAGHIVILALIGMIFTFASYFLIPFILVMPIGIMFLEILVGFIQAFVFTLLVSVFIGQLREGAH